MVRQVKISNFTEVQGIVAAAIKCHNEVGVHDIKGSIADAKSILGLMSLDFSQPVKIVFLEHWRNLLLAVGTRIGSDAAFYVFALFPLVFLPAIGVDKQIAINAGIVASIGQASGIPLFGWLSDKFGTRKVLLWGAVLNILWLALFFPMLETASVGMIYFAAFGALFCLAAMWAPLAAHLPKMFPVEVRFTGAGLGFQAAGILGGAIAPTICVSLFGAFGSPVPVVLYLTALLVLAWGCVYATCTE